MTREEAIKWVKFVHDVLYEDKDEDIRTALDMAIEALQREEAEEKGYCHRIKPKEYLSADAVQGGDAEVNETKSPYMQQSRHDDGRINSNT